MVLHTLWVGETIKKLIVFAPGSASIILESLRLRVPVLCIFRNSTHRDVILNHLAELLKPLIMDPTDIRFYRSETTEAQSRFGL